ncbi:MAG: hypothetical protein WBZ36_12065 [Candidatus Nitrosopolaris sp.]
MPVQISRDISFMGTFQISDEERVKHVLLSGVDMLNKGFAFTFRDDGIDFFRV